MTYWNLLTPIKFIASIVWNISEYTGIGLGKFAPLTFDIMIEGNKKMIKYWTTSGNVELTEYDSKTKSLIIQYRNGKRYMYDNVPRKIWEELIEAGSIGSFLHTEIKGKYGYVDVTGMR